jgi:hypothetical protein
MQLSNPRLKADEESTQPSHTSKYTEVTRTVSTARAVIGLVLEADSQTEYKGKALRAASRQLNYVPTPNPDSRNLLGMPFGSLRYSRQTCRSHSGNLRLAGTRGVHNRCATPKANVIAGLEPLRRIRLVTTVPKDAILPQHNLSGERGELTEGGIIHVYRLERMFSDVVEVIRGETGCTMYPGIIVA